MMGWVLQDLNLSGMPGWAVNGHQFIGLCTLSPPLDDRLQFLQQDDGSLAVLGSGGTSSSVVYAGKLNGKQVAVKVRCAGAHAGRQGRAHQSTLR